MVKLWGWGNHSHPTLMRSQTWIEIEWQNVKSYTQFQIGPLSVRKKTWVRKHTQVFIEFGLGLEKVVNILNIKTEINGCLQISISAQWRKKFDLSRATMYILVLYIRAIYTLCNIKSTGRLGCDVNESPCICIDTLYNLTVCGNHALRPLELFV